MYESEIDSSTLFWQNVRSFALDATEKAAIACASHRGGGDKIAADEAAVRAMTTAFETSMFDIRVATGEGELDNAPMFSAGDRFGVSHGRQIDLAVDPLEGTTLCSLDMPGSVTVLAAAEGNTLITAPDSYMKKLMVGPNFPAALVDVDRPVRDVVEDYVRHVGKTVNEVSVCVLDKPRHKTLIDEIRSSGAFVYLIPDVDVPAALWVCDPEYFGVDLYMGTGGGPEGIISAAALRCLGGSMSARFVAHNDAQRAKLDAFPGDLLTTKFDLQSMVSGEAVFSMTGVTGSKGLSDVIIKSNTASTQSVILSSFLKTKETIFNETPQLK